MEEEKSPILFGLKHCGKSTLGALAGKKWGMVFRDLDDWLLELAGRRIDPPPASCRELYRKSPEEFRRWESIAAEAAAEEMIQTPMILALGGGAVENSGVLGILRPRGILIYLEEGEDTLYRRIILGGIPPFLNPHDPRTSWKGMYQHRHELCRRAADIILPLGGVEPSGALKLLAGALGRGD